MVATGGAAGRSRHVRAARASTRRTARASIQRTVAALALPLLLTACSAVAPGLHFARGQIPVTPEAAQDPVIIPITAQLVQQERQAIEQQSNHHLAALMATSLPYTIDGGDVLSIVVWDHPELGAGGASPLGIGSAASTDTAAAPAGTPTPASFVVDHRGTVQFPYAGAIKLGGLTEDEARQALTRKLSRYITRPDITLHVQSYRSKRIYVDGEVRSPGLVSINDIPMTLVEALNRAGGTLPAADQSRILIVRASVSYPVNLLQLVQHGVNPASIMLINGDVVRVLSRDESKVFVSGEVTAPKALTMHNGRLTLNEALGEAGGLQPATADGSQIYVIRNGGDARPLVYHLNARSPAELALAEAFELQAKDVVYVDATALATWSRVVNLVLPSAFSGAVSSVATVRAVK
jgi:polysaccharide export outer membrane protein